MSRKRFTLSTAADRTWRTRHVIGLVIAALSVLAMAWTAGSAVIWLSLQLWLPIVAVTWTTRAVSASTLVAFFIAGASVSAPLAALAVTVSTGGQIDGILTRSIWVPLIEEATKILPLAAIFAVGRSRLRRAPSLTDSLLLGLALGAGFSGVEDLARGWDWDRLEALRYGPSIGSWYLFPTADVQEAATSSIASTVFPGHAILTAWIGLTLGIAARQAMARPRFSWTLPGAAFLLAVATHGFFNATSGGDLGVAGASLQWITTVRGHLLLWLFPVAVIGAVWRDRRVLGTSAAASPLPVRIQRWLKYATAPATQA